MRRLILELDVGEIAGKMDDIALDKIELMEVLAFLNEAPDEFAVVCRLRLKDPSTKLSDVIKVPRTDIRVLSREKDGAYVVFVKSNPGDAHDATEGWNQAGGYLTTPYEIRDGKAKMTFLGQPSQVRAFLRVIDKTGVKYRVVLLTDAKFSADSPVTRLTDKQRDALVTAFNAGYYDIPRKIDTDELARKLKIRNPTFVMHRRKAERVILTELLKEL